MRPIEEMNKEEIVVQMPHLCTDLGGRDPAQHSRKFMSLDTKFEQTYDDFDEEHKNEIGPQRRAAAAEGEERAKMERSKQGLDF